MLATSLPSGCAHVAWEAEQCGRERDLRLTWEEHDRSLVLQPERQGFGSTLLHQALGRQLGGKADITCALEGLRVQITALIP